MSFQCLADGGANLHLESLSAFVVNTIIATSVFLP